MKKKRLIRLILLVLIAAVAYKLLLAPQREGVAARYRDQEVTWRQVEQYRSVLSLLGEKGERSDRAIVDRILQGYILADEAKKLGVTVSESEVGAKLGELKPPDGKSTLEDYLSRVGGTLKDGMELLRQQIRARLTLEKLREAMAREYCSDHGIDFSSDNIPEEVSRAVNERLDGLLESHKDEIEYYF